MELNFGIVEGLPDEEQRQLRELKYIYDYHRTTNRKKRRYYNGKITLQEVNLGIALPYGIRRLQIGCSWGAKTVDVLASRSMFDGFVTENGTKSEHMDAIMRRNHLIAEYNKAVKEELKYGFMQIVIVSMRSVLTDTVQWPDTIRISIWKNMKMQVVISMLCGGSGMSRIRMR